MENLPENEVFDIDTFGNLAILGFVMVIFGMAAYSICQMG